MQVGARALTGHTHGEDSDAHGSTVSDTLCL